MIWTTYCLESPIDFFYNATTISEMVKHFIENRINVAFDNQSYDYEELRDFLKNYAEALQAAEEIGYDKYYPRQEPRVTWIPNNISLTPVFMFKNDNNGQTFIVSSEDLPYLDKYTLH